MRQLLVAIIFWIVGTILSYFFGVQYVYNYVFNNFGISFDWQMLFYQGNRNYFYVLSFLGTAAPLYILIGYLGSKFSKSGKYNKEDYSEMVTTRQVKRRMLKVSFNTGNIYLTNFDKIEIAINTVPKSLNKMIEKVGIEHLIKLKTLDTWFIGGELVYKRCGLPFVTKYGVVWLDPSPSHTLIVGTTNSGKSYSLILPMLIFMAMSGESGVAIDIKGELSEMTAPFFEQLGYDVYFLDFLDPENSDCWNPLFLGAKEYVKQKEVEQRELKEMSDWIVKEKKRHSILNENSNVPFDISTSLGKTDAGDQIFESKTGKILTNADYSLAQELFRDVVQAITSDKQADAKDGFWNDEAGRVLEGYVHLVAEEGNQEYVNIPSIQRTILAGDEIYQTVAKEKISYIKQFLQDYRSIDCTSRERLSSYIDSAESTRKSTRNVLAKHLSSIITNDVVKQILSNNTIQLDQVGKKKSMIFLKVHDEKKTYYPLITLFIKQLWQELVKTARESPDKTLPIPFNIVFDELGQFPKFEEITNVLTAGRSRGVRFTGVVQGYDQLEEKYGKTGSRTIKNNVMNTVYLLSGDPETLEELSKRCGSKIVRENGKNTEKRNVTVDRLKEFKLGETLFLRQRQGAYITKLLPFNKYNFYRSLTKYELKNKPKRNPQYFDIIEVIENDEE